MLHLDSLRAAAAFACLLANAAAQLTVTGVTPTNNARGVSPAAVVTLTFSTAVDPTTITAQNLKLAGRWSGPVPVLMTIGGGGTTVTLAPQRPLFATEIATLTVANAVRSAGGASLLGGFAAIWWVDAAPSTGTFVLDHTVDYRRPGEGLIRTYGFFAGDIDRDGAPDMSATNEVSFDIRLLKNNGCGAFGPSVITPMPGGEEPSPNEGADFNGDGWIDLATGNQSGQSVAVFFNDGAGNYLPPLLMPAGGQVHGLALLDADSDGDVDIAATNIVNVLLLRNNGNGTFAAPVLFNAGNGEWSLAAADANGDGKVDLFCGSSGSQAVAVLLGDGNGGFAVGPLRPCGGFPWQMATGDVNGDGKADCVVANNNNATAGVLLGDGLGGLGAATLLATGPNPVSVDIGDAEGDDDLDVVVASFSGGYATLWRNNGNGTFANPSTLPAASAGSCAVIVDHDRDGDTDVILVDEITDTAFVWRQLGPNAPSTQLPSCAAALRVNSLGGRAGFGGAPPQPLPTGRLAFVNTSGGAGQPYALVTGAQLAPGLPLLTWGTANIDLTQPFDILVNGFFGGPVGLLDGNGEQVLAFAIPPGLPPGATTVLQCVVNTPAGFVLTNAETVVF